jgi:CcmD family protein
VVVLLCFAGPLLDPAFAATPGHTSGADGAGAAIQPPPTPDEFVPVGALPPEEQLPAAPLLVIAYALVWIVLVLYLWSIRRRLGAVERELADLGRRTAGPRGGA